MSERANGRVPAGQPIWDSERRELRVGQVVLKHYKQPSDSQALILNAFQEQNWPRRIDDPLPPRPGQYPKTRLHQTIANLNRAQKPHGILFSGDGTGTGIRWQHLPW